MNRLCKHYRWLLTPALLGVLLLGVPHESLADSKMYRYRNAEGVMVIDNKISPEDAARGYDILSASGRLLEKVPPHVPVTEEEKERRKQLAFQQVEDKFLLRSYSSTSEIEAARDRKLETLRREIALIEDNLKSTRQMRKDEERRAANFQRGGREVSVSLLKQLKELKRKEQEALKMLEQRREESRQQQARYESYINRYKELSEPDNTDNIN